jgi:hypothetical protein
LTTLTALAGFALIVLRIFLCSGFANRLARTPTAHRNDGNHEIVVVSPRLYRGANWPDGIKELLESAIPHLA